MIRALWTSSTGMKAQMTNLDVISNNLANVNTTGFKKSRAEFQDLLYQTLKAPGVSTGPDSIDPVGEQVGVGTRLSAITKEFSEGSLTHTGRELDVAIEGKGFFVVEGFDGEDVYTRDGTFKLSDTGEIVTSDGLVVSGLGSIPENAVSINIGTTGIVSYIDDTQEETQVGNVQLAMFVNPSGLSALGRNLYAETPASGTATLVEPGLEASGTLQQCFLELSNVSLVEEMVNMITAQRGYEVNSKAIKTADEMLQTATNIAR